MKEFDGVICSNCGARLAYKETTLDTDVAGYKGRFLEVIPCRCQETTRQREIKLAKKAMATRKKATSVPKSIYTKAYGPV